MSKHCLWVGNPVPPPAVPTRTFGICNVTFTPPFVPELWLISRKAWEHLPTDPRSWPVAANTAATIFDILKKNCGTPFFKVTSFARESDKTDQRLRLCLQKRSRNFFIYWNTCSYRNPAPKHGTQRWDSFIAGQRALFIHSWNGNIWEVHREGIEYPIKTGFCGYSDHVLSCSFSISIRKRQMKNLQNSSL